jgi:DnaK suppressor protein
MVDLTKAEVRSRLLKLRQELESLGATSDQSSQVVELDQTRVGRLSRMDAMQAQAMSVESGRRRKLMLRRIDVALARVDSGDYGLCQTCEKPINPKRLDFDPAALLCIECAERAE